MTTVPEVRTIRNVELVKTGTWSISSGEWTVTADDSHTWTRPWTFGMNLSKRDQSQQPFEYACHEGNYGLRNILSAARSVDKAEAK